MGKITFVFGGNLPTLVHTIQSPDHQLEAYTHNGCENTHVNTNNTHTHTHSREHFARICFVLYTLLTIAFTYCFVLYTIY